MAQQRPTDGSFVPGQEKAASTGLGIDLGSRYASQLGFEGIQAYDSDSTSSNTEIAKSSSFDSSNSKKKKKKKRNKKKDIPAEKNEPDKIEEGYEVEIEC